MRKFKIGDRVRLIELPLCSRQNNRCKECYIGAKKEIKEGCRGLLVSDMDSIMHCSAFEEDMNRFLELIQEGEMDRYTELKGRIEGVEAWDKGADDILQEILKETDRKCVYAITIHCENTASGTRKVKIVDFDNGNKIHFSIGFTTQCEKLEAFKKALMWLLDHSNIKKTLVGKEVDADIEGKVYKVRILQEARCLR